METRQGITDAGNETVVVEHFSVDISHRDLVLRFGIVHWSF